MAGDTNWMRDRESMGVWEYRGTVVVVGWGQSHMDRRWDGVTINKSCGGLSREAYLKAISDAGLALVREQSFSSGEWSDRPERVLG